MVIITTAITIMVITIMAITGIGAGTMAIIIIMAITIITTAITTTTTVTTTTNDKKPADAVGRLTTSAGSPLIHAAHVPLTPVGSRASGE